MTKDNRDQQALGFALLATQRLNYDNLSASQRYDEIVCVEDGEKLAEFDEYIEAKLAVTA